jgi:hypothetical protein
MRIQVRVQRSPEIGDVHDQAEQRRLVEVRMYGERLIIQ